MTDIMAQAQTSISQHWPLDTPDLAPKLLRALIQYAPTPGGAAWIAAAVVSCEGNKQLLKQLGDYYLNQFIVPLKAHGGSRLHPSSHPSREEEEVDVQLRIARGSKRDKTVKDNALRRDGHKCVICGIFDWNSDDAVTIGEGEATVGAHIIPFSVVPNDKDHTSVVRSGILFNMLQNYAAIDQELIDGDKINDVSNIITLSVGCHASFGDLRCCLDPVDGMPDAYTFRKFRPGRGPRDGTIVTLTTTDATLPVANRKFLALHAACAKVAHASGAAEYVEAAFRDREEIAVLAFDGTSAGALHQLLNMIPAH